ncbi:hypothetical protein [Spongiibacter sp.]|uniref:Flp family type IVb pilin n=1 Tax=Spongiibacter sp. TaxID=2024860 RepID=UPI000C516F18|nr:hypothetical protein [Spongiibacter sp.]MAY40242.1 Flp family type IVb pilin [Spongiibacter sp.]
MMLKQIKDRVVQLASDERGASAIEYAVMAAVLVGAIYAAVVALDLTGVFTAISSNVQTPSGA